MRNLLNKPTFLIGFTEILLTLIPVSSYSPNINCLPINLVGLNTKKEKYIWQDYSHQNQ